MFSVTIEGERQTLLRFDEFPQRARAGLRTAIEESTSELRDLILGKVPRRTGKLAAMIQERITESDNRIVGSVFVTGDFGKAGALEYGTHRTITMKLSHVFSKIVPTLDVRRTLNIEPRGFLRGPEAAIADSAVEKMKAALDEAADES